MNKEELLDHTFNLAVNQEGGWSYEDYESSNNRVAHRTVFTPWGYICSYQIIASNGDQVEADRAEGYFDRRLTETIEHFIDRGRIK